MLTFHSNYGPYLISFQDKAWSIIVTFFTPYCYSTLPLGDTHRNIIVTFSAEKLEWPGYQTVKNFHNLFTRFDTKHERDRHTDGRTPYDSSIGCAMHRVAGQKRRKTRCVSVQRGSAGAATSIKIPGILSLRADYFDFARIGL